MAVTSHSVPYMQSEETGPGISFLANLCARSHSPRKSPTQRRAPALDRVSPAGQRRRHLHGKNQRSIRGRRTAESPHSDVHADPSLEVSEFHSSLTLPQLRPAPGGRWTMDPPPGAAAGQGYCSKPGVRGPGVAVSAQKTGIALHHACVRVSVDHPFSLRQHPDRKSE